MNEPKPPEAKEPEKIPRDILITLFRGLAHGGYQCKREDVEKAWAWLEKYNHYEEMGQ